MQTIGGVTSPLFRDLFRREEARLALVRSRWTELVGSSLARRLVPKRFAGGVLSVEVCDARWEKAATEVAPDLEQRLRLELPEVAVERVELVTGLNERRRKPRRGRAH